LRIDTDIYIDFDDDGPFPAKPMVSAGSSDEFTERVAEIKCEGFSMRTQSSLHIS
jgi:hypothetical protein